MIVSPQLFKQLKRAVKQKDEDYVKYTTYAQICIQFKVSDDTLARVRSVDNYKEYKQLRRKKG